MGHTSILSLIPQYQLELATANLLWYISSKVPSLFLGPTLCCPAFGFLSTQKKSGDFEKNWNIDHGQSNPPTMLA